MINSSKGTHEKAFYFMFTEKIFSFIQLKKKIRVMVHSYIHIYNLNQ